MTKHILKALGLTIHKQQIFVKNKWIQTYRFGEGKKTILVLPGFPHSGIYCTWLFARHDLSKINVTSFDLPGWVGESEAYKKSEKFSIRDMVEITSGVINHFNLEDVRILGYSFGSAIGLLLACKLRSKIKSLVLVSPYIFGDSLKDNHFAPLVRILKFLGWGWVVKYYINSVFNRYSGTLEKEGLDGDFLKYYRELITKSDNRILLESIYSLFFTDLSCNLEKMNVTKIMIVNSPHESLMFKEQARLIRLKLKNEDTMYIHGGHSDFVLRPDGAVVDRIINFLAQ